LLLLVDTVNVASPGGLQLLEELERSIRLRRPEEARVVVLRAVGDGPAPDPEDRVEIVSCPRAGGWIGMRRWFHRTLPDLARRHRADVVYSLSGVVSRRLARVCGTVNAVNNMLPFTPEHIRHFPIWSSERIRFLLLQKLYASGSRIADALVVPSRYGAERVSAYAGDLMDKSFVAMNPIPDDTRYDPAAPPAHPYGGKPFLFYLSVVFWYKNHLNLIEAYRRAVAAGNELPDLLMAGPPSDPDYVAKIRQAIEDPHLKGRVKYLGKVPRDDVPGYLHHATINVFPSTCETSSFVQAEILGARGVMACSDWAPMPEIAGDAAELFDPHDPDSIADVLLRLCADEARRDELRRLAERRAGEFTREACGDAIWAAARRAEEAYVARRRA
jgi:glycosyltransferase involved in cell wall biosynthesis